MTGEPPGLFGTCSKEPSIRDATCNEDRFIFVQRRTAHHTRRFAYSRNGAPSHLRNIALHSLLFFGDLCERAFKPQHPRKGTSVAGAVI